MRNPETLRRRPGHARPGQMPKDVEEKDRIVIRFAGDSGDGMQLNGDRFTNATAVLGNDLATLPDFPAEIRAPAGTVHGVSAFQIQFASEDITTPGDHPNVLVAMMDGRPNDVTLNWLHKKFGDKPKVYDANVAAFKAGYNFGETTELFAHSYLVKPAPAKPGTYRNVSGSQALALGLVAARQRSALSLFYASYPITPASELLHELSRLKNFGVRTLQAEDEIAAANVALGAAFVGQLGVTGTSGPGMDLKAETIGLAVALELPMVIVDVQRAGPSTGMPTKTEAADLLLAMYGRHGESPIPIVAPHTPASCFNIAVEAVRIAVKYRTPVIILTDTFLGNSSEPWRLPDLSALPAIDPHFATQINHDDGFMGYLRDENLARPWAVPGTPGLEHRIGGLEKEDVSGNISYDAQNHERMTHLRAAKVAKIADDIPSIEVDDPDEDAELLVL